MLSTDLIIDPDVLVFSTHLIIGTDVLVFFISESELENEDLLSQYKFTRKFVLRCTPIS